MLAVRPVKEYGLVTPVAVAVPVTVPPAVISTNSIFHEVSVPPAVQLKSAELVVILFTNNVFGSGQEGGSGTIISNDASNSSAGASQDGLLSTVLESLGETPPLSPITTP